MQTTKSGDRGYKQRAKDIPWQFTFTCEKPQPKPTEIKKDLLAACWGNEKMADLLYHILYCGSWAANNAHPGEKSTTHILHEKHKDIREKMNIKISEPTLIGYLKLFALAGYITKIGRKETIKIHFDVIEKAFLNPPDKPIAGKVLTQNFSQDLSSNLNLNANLNSELGEEVIQLRREVVDLRSQVAVLTSTLAQFNVTLAHIERGLNLDLSSTLVQNDDQTWVDTACDEDLSSTTEPLVISNSNSMDVPVERETDFASATSPDGLTPSEGKPKEIVEEESSQGKDKGTGRGGGRGRGRGNALKVVVPELTGGGTLVFDAWCSLFRSGVPLGPKTIEAANDLYPLLIPWAEFLNVDLAKLLKNIKQWMFKVNEKNEENGKTNFYAHGIKLPDVKRDFEGWQEAMERKYQALDNKDDIEDDSKRNPYNIHKLAQRRREQEEREEVAN